MFLEIDGDETALLLVKVLFAEVACLKLVSGKVIHANFVFGPQSVIFFFKSTSEIQTINQVRFNKS